MTQEDKTLLLRDLCARLPFEVKIQYEGDIFTIDYISGTYEEVKLDTPDNYTIGVSEVKPYLFPLSSMTEEELREYNYLYAERENNNEADDIEQYSDLIDWFNKHHFDYRGLIEKSLALDATNLNIY